jgi:hypothetical protein
MQVLSMVNVYVFKCPCVSVLRAAVSQFRGVTLVVMLSQGYAVCGLLQRLLSRGHHPKCLSFMGGTLFGAPMCRSFFGETGVLNTVREPFTVRTGTCTSAGSSLQQLSAEEG